MKTAKLLQALCKRVEQYERLEWLDEYTEHDMCSFRPIRRPKGEVLTKQVGPWFTIVVNIAFEGNTMDPSCDRSDGDPYSALVRYDWIGLDETVPRKNIIPKTLDDWAIHKSSYSREYTATGSRGVHRGTWVTGLDIDGTLHLRDAEGWFLDVAPESKTTERTVQLELPK